MLIIENIFTVNGDHSRNTVSQYHKFCFFMASNQEEMYLCRRSLSKKVSPCYMVAHGLDWCTL